MEPDSAQVRDFIERLVESLVSGQLDDVTLNRLYTHPECKCHEYCGEMLDSRSILRMDVSVTVTVRNDQWTLLPLSCLHKTCSLAVNVHICSLDIISIPCTMSCRQYGKHFGSDFYLSPQNITSMGQNIITYLVTSWDCTSAALFMCNDSHHVVYGMEQVQGPTALYESYRKQSYGW